MDEAVTMTRAAVTILLFTAAFATSGAHAEVLQDPTRPAASAFVSTAAPGTAVSGPRLQSILVGRDAGGRHLAVIDGETVRLGEQFHGARVSRIGDNEVELVRGAERQVLRLYAEPAAGMTPLRAQGQAQAQARTPVRR
jgi:MSHA biogenesis protein MshK